MIAKASGLPNLASVQRHVVIAARFATSWRDWMTILSQGQADTTLEEAEKVERLRSKVVVSVLPLPTSMDVPETDDSRRRRAKTEPKDPPLAPIKHEVPQATAKTVQAPPKSSEPSSQTANKQDKPENGAPDLPLANTVDRTPSPLQVTDTSPIPTVTQSPSEKNSFTSSSVKSSDSSTSSSVKSSDSSTSSTSSSAASPLNLPLASAVRIQPDPPDAPKSAESQKPDESSQEKCLPGSERNVELPSPVHSASGEKAIQHVAIDLPDPSNNELALSLSGCGFLGSYHFGVMICFRNNAKKFMSRVTRIAGASGGSLVAAVAVMRPDQLETSLERLYSLADELNSLTFGALTPGFYLNERLSHIVDVFIPDDLSCIQNRLFVSLTRNKDKTNRIVSTYPDKAYLQKCLLASCFIPMYSMGYGAIPPEIDGDSYIDGGYTENLPTFKDIQTITVSPFSGSALICPHDQTLFEWKMTLGNQLLKVNMSNVVRGAQALFPPSRRTLHAYYEMGYRDGMKYLLNNGHLERAVGTPV